MYNRQCVVYHPAFFIIDFKVVERANDGVDRGDKTKQGNESEN